MSKSPKRYEFSIAFNPPLATISFAYAVSKEAFSLAQKYTRTRPILCEDEPDAHTAWIKIDHQSFCIGTQPTEGEASVICYQAAVALARMIGQWTQNDFKITAEALKGVE